MMREQFDVIVGNPPWLSYRYIEEPEYQAEIKKRALDDYHIAPKEARLITQMELATVFLAHAMGRFSKKGGALAFVMPRSILSADQHHLLRIRQYAKRCRFRWEGYWDLKDVKPLFKVPSCVIFVSEADHFGPPDQQIPAREWTGTLDDKNMSWAEAADHLGYIDKSARVIYLGSRSALSTVLGSHRPTLSSPYAKQFHDGATIYPRNFFFVSVRDLDGEADPGKDYWIETDPEQAADSKKPYDEVNLRGHIEGRFLFSSALAKHVLPFVVLPPPTVVLPLEVQGARPKLLDVEELRKRGYRHCAKWMGAVEKIWKEKRGAKASRMDLLEQLDYQGKLSNQDLDAAHLVLYAASGTNLSVACFERSSFPLTFLVDHKLYWGAFQTRRESNYVAAILNSTSINEAIKPFQSLGNQGERDIHKKVLDLAIPKYDPAKSLHCDLAELGDQARRRGAILIKSEDFPGRIVGQRDYLRQGIKDVLAEIDGIAKKLI
jgi:hypothetical protein